jgi:hypothetical protein
MNKFIQVWLISFWLLPELKFLKVYVNYPMKKVSKIVTLLREIDVKSKGVGANALPQHELLKEMLVGIFN